MLPRRCLQPLHAAMPQHLARCISVSQAHKLLCCAERTRSCCPRCGPTMSTPCRSVGQRQLQYLLTQLPQLNYMCSTLNLATVKQRTSATSAPTAAMAWEQAPMAANSASISLCDAATAIDAGLRCKSTGVACSIATSQPRASTSSTQVQSSHAVIAAAAATSGASAAPRSWSNSSANPGKMASNGSRACAASAADHANPHGCCAQHP